MRTRLTYRWVSGWGEGVGEGVRGWVGRGWGWEDIGMRRRKGRAGVGCEEDGKGRSSAKDDSTHSTAFAPRK
jgi:hypothetical protein